MSAAHGTRPSMLRGGGAIKSSSTFVKKQTRRRGGVSTCQLSRLADNPPGEEDGSAIWKYFLSNRADDAV